MAIAMTSSPEPGIGAPARGRSQSGLGLNALRASSSLRHASDPPEFTQEQRSEFLRALYGILEVASATRRQVPDVSRAVSEKVRTKASVEGVRLVVSAIRSASAAVPVQAEDQVLATLVNDLVNLVDGRPAEHPDALLAYLDSIAASATMQRPTTGDIVVRGRRGASRARR